MMAVDYISGIYSAGMDAASNGHGLRENPHTAGSAEWWAWNDGYQASKKIEADMERHKAFEARK